MPARRLARRGGRPPERTPGRSWRRHCKLAVELMWRLCFSRADGPGDTRIAGALLKEPFTPVCAFWYIWRELTGMSMAACDLRGA
mmetsp:Transcript_20/g.30  ORF Transcript_20/g.30 Transcript_20/m.30 type:complete len:85 (-) Transcript_20:192-446(-)